MRPLLFFINISQQMSLILENVSLAPFTTLKIGGPARFYLKALNEDDVLNGINYASERNLSLFVLGGGSNILVSDNGFNGVVLHISLKGIKIVEETESYIRLDVAAGEEWDSFVQYCVNNGYYGIESMSGIPGTVGGTPVQNVGAYGQEVSETIECVRAYDLIDRTFVELSNSECEFAYRKSIFNTIHRDRYIVTSVRYKLKKDDGSMQELALPRNLGDVTEEKPSLSRIREIVLQVRRAKSMVIDENDPNSKSAGSFFKNPIVETSIAESIPDVPKYPGSDGKVKLSAAWLIENAGFNKGFKLNNAGVSAKHSLAIVNLGEASANEIIDLMKMIQQGVLKKYGIELTPEPVFIGF